MVIDSHDSVVADLDEAVRDAWGTTSSRSSEVRGRGFAPFRRGRSCRLL